MRQGIVPARWLLLPLQSFSILLAPFKWILRLRHVLLQVLTKTAARTSCCHIQLHVGHNKVVRSHFVQKFWEAKVALINELKAGEVIPTKWNLRHLIHFRKWFPYQTFNWCNVWSVARKSRTLGTALFAVNCSSWLWKYGVNLQF